MDNFDLNNYPDGLRARGYATYKNGTSSGTSNPYQWFQGINAANGAFDAYNGADTSYAAANFFAAGSFGNIDNWLVLPPLNVLAGDEISFYSRSFLNDPFPDSIRVMYNALDDTSATSPGWVELGRFKVNTTGSWLMNSYTAISSSINGRFAIRYCVVNGGTLGDNSDYVGIDALNVSRDEPLPVELSSFFSVISNNNVKLNWSTATELNNSGFDIERGSNGQWIKIGNVAGSGTISSPVNYTFTDRNLSTGNYSYRLKQIDFNGSFVYFNLTNEVNIGVPAGFELSQNYPNPFNPSTKIDYQIPNDGNVKISVYDNSGKEVMNLVNDFKTAGYYTVSFNASTLSSGIYFYKITSGNFSGVKKMMLVK